MKDTLSDFETGSVIVGICIASYDYGDPAMANGSFVIAVVSERRGHLGVTY